MQKTILITGATDGIGLATARKLLESGHQVLLHGRDSAKLDAVEKTLSELPGAGQTEKFVADLSNMGEVVALASAVAEKHAKIDVLINNAEVFKAPNNATAEGLDVRFAVNTIAPYFLTQRLLPVLGADARVVNVSSAAQAPVDPVALAAASSTLDDMGAYAQSKLAIIMWSRSMALSLPQNSPSVFSVNPGSLLASKMVKEAFGSGGNDIGIGADILSRAALADEFADVSGLYFDNDSGQFAEPHPDALDSSKVEDIVRAIESVLSVYERL